MESTESFITPESLAVSDSGFLFLASTGETFTLNPIGRELFGMLKEGMNRSAMSEAILVKYDVDAKTLERDLDDFLSQLKSYKLINAR